MSHRYPQQPPAQESFTCDTCEKVAHEGTCKECVEGIIDAASPSQESKWARNREHFDKLRRELDAANQEIERLKAAIEHKP